MFPARKLCSGSSSTTRWFCGAQELRLAAVRSLRNYHATVTAPPPSLMVRRVESEYLCHQPEAAPDAGSGRPTAPRICRCGARSAIVFRVHRAAVAAVTVTVCQ